MPKRYTPQQNAVVSQHSQVSARILARHHALDGRSADAIRQQAHRLHVRSTRYHCWTGKELTFLRIALSQLCKTLKLRPTVIARRLVEIAKEMER